MRGILPKIHAAGAELIVIGNGSPTMAAAFVDDVGLTSPVYTDPARAAYAAAGLKRSVLATLSPSAIGRAVRAMRRGFRQTGTRGDPWQQGGVFVVATGGRVVYAHRDSTPGDNAPLESLLAGLRSLEGPE